jgi:hypothetical protein
MGIIQVKRGRKNKRKRKEGKADNSKENRRKKEQNKKCRKAGMSFSSVGTRKIKLNTLCVVVRAADMIPGCVKFCSVFLITGVYGSDSGRSLRTCANKQCTQNYTEANLYNGHTFDLYS